MAKISEPTKCIIGEGSVFEGKFYVSGSILIDGKFQGDIKTDDQVIVGPKGKVKTDIDAKRVTIAGTIIGNIIASEEVLLLETGKVLGNIKTPKLNVEAGVITKGEITITAQTGESVDKTIEEAFGEDAELFFKSLGGESMKQKE